MNLELALLNHVVLPRPACLVILSLELREAFSSSILSNLGKVQSEWAGFGPDFAATGRYPPLPGVTPTVSVGRRPAETVEVMPGSGG